MSLPDVTTSQMKAAASAWKAADKKNKTGVYNRIDELIDEIERLRAQLSALEGV